MEERSVGILPAVINPRFTGVAAEPPMQRLDYPPDRPAEGARQARNLSTRLANQPFRSNTTGLIFALCPQSRWRRKGTLRRLFGQAVESIRRPGEAQRAEPTNRL